MNKIFLFIILFTLLVSCSKKEEFKESVIKEKSLDLQVLEAYQEGMKNLESGDVIYAAKKFNEPPTRRWSPRRSRPTRCSRCRR